MIIPVMHFHLVLVTCSVLVITNQYHKNFISEVNHHLSSAFHTLSTILDMKNQR